MVFFSVVNQSFPGCETTTEKIPFNPRNTPQPEKIPYNQKKYPPGRRYFLWLFIGFGVGPFGIFCGCVGIFYGCVGIFTDVMVFLWLCMKSNALI